MKKKRPHYSLDAIRQIVAVRRVNAFTASFLVGSSAVRLVAGRTGQGSHSGWLALPRERRDRVSAKDGERYAEALEKLRTKVDVEEAAGLTGGVNAFSRYENGKAKPVPAVINLF